MGRLGTIVLLILAVIGGLSLFGLFSPAEQQEQPQEETRYVCPDGRTVSDRQACETNTQYVCPDNSIVEDPQNCPTDEEENDDPPDGGDPPQQTHEYEVAHGDILEDGECHIRVSGPDQPVQVNSSGTYEVKRVFASSASELERQVENIRQGAANHAGMPCPDG